MLHDELDRRPVVAWEWVVTGLILIAAHVGLLKISANFQYGQDILKQPVDLLAGLLIFSGFVYLLAVWRLNRPFRGGRHWWIWMLGVGFALRLIMLFSTPMMDDDHYRYMWDGAMVAHGYSPYANSPREVTANNSPQELRDLAIASGSVIERVNHPWLRTIYPPVAQAAFGMAHRIAPWRILGLRLVWMLADVVTVAILASLLKSVGLPPHSLLVYWWNPLLIKEAYNTAHMELLILPFVVGSLVLAVRGRHVRSAAALALGAGAKFWPVLLLPALIRRTQVNRRQGMTMGATFVVVACAVTAPLIASAFDSSSGLRAYATHWEMNDSLYTLFHAAGAFVMPESSHVAARAIVGTLLVSWMAWLCRTPAVDGRQLCERALWSVAALFLLSPTQFPWYWLWMLPLLAVRPTPGLLVLTATLPLYYLRFSMRELGHVAWFDYGVVWIEFGPALALLAWEARRGLHPRPRPQFKASPIHES